ncbi:hypothetical protein JYT96_01180 [Gammaproteobacteria bacterium AH-315-C21]|nr:hypothetical protein [Gammaproteobacteria bacterium AH-315-C21]
MSELLLLLAGLFLPLFPLSMVFNEVFQRIRVASLRVALLVIWPQIGVALVLAAGIDIPAWVGFWALFTALLYGFRALALREVGLWTGFIATSAWAVLWLVMGSTVEGQAEWFQQASYALALSAPLALLALLGGELEKRFGAAYTGLYGGLALSQPRLSGVLVFVVLAIVATPFSPGFSVMMAAIIESSLHSFFVAVTVAMIWLLWSWAGARLLQGIIVGPAQEKAKADLSINSTWVYVLILILLVVSGIYSIGNLG